LEDLKHLCEFFLQLIGHLHRASISFRESASRGVDANPMTSM
jgi:hypothetical protein